MSSILLKKCVYCCEKTNKTGKITYSTFIRDLGRNLCRVALNNTCGLYLSVAWNWPLTETEQCEIRCYTLKNSKTRYLMDFDDWLKLGTFHQINSNRSAVSFSSSHIIQTEEISDWSIIICTAILPLEATSTTAQSQISLYVWPIMWKIVSHFRTNSHEYPAMSWISLDFFFAWLCSVMFL